MIIIEHLSHQFKNKTYALRDINLCLGKKKRVAIIGSNGSGKSTLLFYLNCLYIAREGKISIDGEVVTEANAARMRKKTGLLFDSPDNQIFCPTVRDDIAFALNNLEYTQQKISCEVSRIANQLKISSLLDAEPHHLSLGQKKKVAIAGILVFAPEFLILDEPFSGLDNQAIEDLKNTLLTLEADNKMQIITTHDLNFVYEWADEVVILHKNKIICIGDYRILENLSLLRCAQLSPPTIVSIFYGKQNGLRNPKDARAYLDQMTMDKDK